MRNDQTIAQIRRKYPRLVPEMDERRRRQWAAAEAREWGWGGVSLVARATGLSRPTITAGLRELDQPTLQCAAAAARVRPQWAALRAHSGLASMSRKTTPTGASS